MIYDFFFCDCSFFFFSISNMDHGDPGPQVSGRDTADSTISIKALYQKKKMRRKCDVNIVIDRCGW